jgi:NAD(P)-dependent dehydrogenase (short-subunit alcohol dehydrogenase family)
MARGRSLSLAPDSQQLLAQWADKTAMALIAADEAAAVTGQTLTVDGGLVMR